MPDAARSLHEEALQRVLGVARLLSATANLQEILQVIIDAMRDTLSAERATVFEYDAKTGELFTNVAHGIEPGAARAVSKPGLDEDDSAERQIRFPITQGIAGEAARTRNIINVPDAYADDRFNRDVDRRTGFRTRSILSIPLLDFDGDLIGVAQVLNKRGGSFNELDEQIAAALGAQAAVAIKRGRFIKALLQRQKLERDLQLARLIQQKTFPTQVPSIPGFDLAAWSEPAEETGGDMYDVIGLAPDENGEVGGVVVDLSRPASRAVLMMADATGHGVGPAIMAASVRAMTRMAVRVGTSLQKIVEHLNHQICQDAPPGRFITAWLGVLDGSAKTLTHFSAGQAPLLRYRAADDSFQVLDSDDMPFGIADEWTVKVTEPTVMAPGDMFAALSDGFFEACNPAGEQFATARIMEVLRTNRHATCAQMIDALREAVAAFTEGVPAADDKTAVLIKRIEG